MITEHFSAAVTYRRPDGTTGVVIVGGKTAQEAQEAADRDARYYLGISYAIEGIVLVAYCARCGGTGKAQAKRNRLRQIVCPDCRGKNSERTLKSGV